MASILTEAGIHPGRATGRRGPQHRQGLENFPAEPRGVVERQPLEGLAPSTGIYLPREVFFGRFGFAAASFSVFGNGFSRFFPAMHTLLPSATQLEGA